MLRLDVPSMHCEGCVKGVTRAVQRAAPQAGVTVDLAARTVAVDGRIDEAAVLQALSRAGFEATRQSAP